MKAFLFSLLSIIAGLCQSSQLLAQSTKGSTVELDVHLHHVYEGKPLLFDSLRYQAVQGEPFSVSRFAYLLSNMSLEKKDGTLVKLDAVAFIDAQRRTQFKIKNIPRGEYRALHLHLGVDQETNHGDPAQYPAHHPLNPILNKLHWDWEGGYIFLALEGRFKKTAKVKDLSGFVYHLARDQNFTRLSLVAPLDLRDYGRLNVSFDLQALLNAPQAISFSTDGHSTHSNEGDLVPEKLKANLRTALRVLSFENTTALSAPRAQLKPLYLPRKITPYPLTISRTFPLPPLPLDNPLLKERIDLGEKLFFDARLSRNDSINCASCHQSQHAHSDPRRFSIGLDGKKTPRHSMPLFNLAWKNRFFWDGRATSLREQVLEPIQDPIEMHSDLATLPAKLSQIEGFPASFAAAFGSEEITPEKIGLALESFLLTLTSTDSKFDRAMKGKGQLSEQEKRGLELFFMEYEPRHGKKGADCFHCHGGVLFTDQSFHDNGLPLLAGPQDGGLAKATGKKSDHRKFATPSLRNIALTAPYMHDGRFKTLEEVVDHYSSGLHRSETLDPNLAKHPVAGIQLSDADKAALIAFLKTLTDPKYEIRP